MKRWLTLKVLKLMRFLIRKMEAMPLSKRPSDYTSLMFRARQTEWTLYEASRKPHPHHNQEG